MDCMNKKNPPQVVGMTYVHGSTGARCMNHAEH